MTPSGTMKVMEKAKVEEMAKVVETTKKVVKMLKMEAERSQIVPLD